MNPLLTREQLITQHCSALEGHSPLEEAALSAQLGQLSGWVADGGFICRAYSFDNYYQTIAFVNALAWLIHGEDHHPELNVTYDRCVVRFNTHSVAGISLNDFICAAKCDVLYESSPGRASA